MPANQPTPDFDDELLSAYVDNELTPAERAAVEERLRTDERARQTLVELQRAADAVKSLPSRRLNRDLTANIWAAIDAAKAEEPAVIALPSRDVRRDSGYRRGLVWTALAIAAALLLMVLRPGAELGDQGSVAKTNEKEKAGAAAPKVEKEDVRDLERAESVPFEATVPSAVRQGADNAEPQLAATPPSERGSDEGAALRPETARSRGGSLADDQFAAGDREAKQATAPPTAHGVAASQAPGAALSKSVAEAESVPEPAAEPAATDAIAAGAPAREQLRTIEVSVPSTDGVATFERLLAERQITMMDEVAGEFAPLAVASESAAILAEKASAPVESTDGAQSGREAQEDEVQRAASVAILVEASPEAIAEIIAALQPQAVSRYTFRQPAQRAAERDAMAATPAGEATAREAGAAKNRAWRVPVGSIADDKDVAAKSAAAEAAARPASAGTLDEERGGGGGRGGFGGGGLGRRALEASEPLERVLFIVRPE
jgi:hypothetical protein